MAKPEFSGPRAESYDAFFSTPFGAKVADLEAKLVLNALSGLKEKVVLEVGSGTGMWLKVLVEKGFTEPIGLDISADMLKVARKKGLRRLVLGDAHRLPFSSNSVDAVLFVTSLEFMREPVKALAEAVRVSRELLVVAFLNRRSLLCTFRRIKAVFKESVYAGARFLTFKDVERMALEAGRVARKQVVFTGRQTTLNLCVDGIVSRKLESLLGFSLRFGGFAVAKFRVGELHEPR